MEHLNSCHGSEQLLFLYLDISKVLHLIVWINYAIVVIRFSIMFSIISIDTVFLLFPLFSRDSFISSTVNLINVYYMRLYTNCSPWEAPG